MAIEIDVKKTALLSMDFQNDIIHPDAPLAQAAGFAKMVQETGILPRSAKVLDAARTGRHEGHPRAGGVWPGRGADAHARGVFPHVGSGWPDPGAGHLGRADSRRSGAQARRRNRQESP